MSVWYRTENICLAVWHFVVFYLAWQLIFKPVIAYGVVDRMSWPDIERDENREFTEAMNFGVCCEF